MSKQKDSSKAEQIRQELWKTFVYEIEELLESMEQQLLELESDYTNEDLIAGLFRTMHTVKGTCGMMGLAKVESFTHKAEDLLDSVRDGKAQINGNILDLLFNVSDILKNSSQDIIEKKSDESFIAPEDIVARLQNLLNNINNLSPALENAINNPPVETRNQAVKENTKSKSEDEDFDMFEELVTETLEAIDELEKTCLELEINYGDKSLINDLFRCVHSLKGNLNLAGMTHATHLLHSTEDIIGQVRDGHCFLVKEHLDLLFQVGDFMRHHFQKMSKVTDFDKVATQPLYKSLELAIQSQRKPDENTGESQNEAGSSENQLNMVEGDGHIQLDIEYVNAFIDLVIEQINPLISNVTSTAIDEVQFKNVIDDLVHAASIVGAGVIVRILQNSVELFSKKSFKDISDKLTQLKNNLSASRNHLDVFVNTFVASAAAPVKAESIETAVPEIQASSTASNTASTWNADSYFEKLWSVLSTMRKTLDTYANEKSTHDEVLAKFAELTSHVNIVSELDVKNLMSEFKAALMSDVPLQEKSEQASRLLQTIYTMCWDLEDSVQEQGSNITFNAYSDVQSDIQFQSSQSLNQNADKLQLETNKTVVTALPGDKVVLDSLHENFTGLSQIPNVNFGELPKLDLNVDPLFVLDFITDARDLIMLLEKEIAGLAPKNLQGGQSDISELKQLIDNISFAAKGVDVFSVQELCDMQLQMLNMPNWLFDKEILNEFVVDLYRIMVQVQDSIPESVQRRHHSDLNLSHVFKQWHAEQCLITAPWLVRTLSGFQQRLEGISRQEQILKIHDDFVKLLPDIIRKVESYLFAAQFYKLSVTEKVILSFRDYIVRAGFDARLLTLNALNLLLDIVKACANLISKVSTEGEASEFDIQHYVDRLVELTEPSVNNAFLASARKFLLSGELPETLEVCLDDETLEKVAEALKEERNIYLLHVDVDHNDEMADGAFDLMNSGKFETLMSATDYIEDRSFFNCLIVSHLNVNTLTQTLKEIDDSQTCLFLKNLAVPLETRADDFVSYVKPIEFQQEHLESLNDSIAELVAAKSTVDQIALGMGQEDLYDQINASIAVHGSWDAARFTVQKLLRKFDDERKSLLLAQDHFSDILYNVQYGLRQLQEVPIASVCEEIQKTIVNDAYFNAEMSFTLDDPDLLIEFQHKIATQESIISIVRFIHEVIVADSGCNIEGQSIVLNVGEHLDDLVFRVQWSNDVGQYFRQNNKAWQSFTGLFSSAFNDKHKHEDRMFSFQETTRSYMDLKIKRHLDILDAIIVRVMADYYVIPTQLVQRIVNSEDAEEVRGSAMDESSMVKVEDKLYPVTVIAKGQDKRLKTNDQKTPRIVLLLQQDRQICSLIVDELLGMQQVVLSPLHGALKSNGRLQSCVVLGKDRIGFVLKSGAVFGQWLQPA